MIIRFMICNCCRKIRCIHQSFPSDREQPGVRNPLFISPVIRSFSLKVLSAQETQGAEPVHLELQQSEGGKTASLPRW